MNPYEIIATLYDPIFEPLSRVLKDVGASMCPPQPGLDVLDVGCGTGTMLERYVVGGCRVAGVDASAAMLEVARQRLGPSGRLILGDASVMPFDDDAFDLVTFTMVLHELDPGTRAAVVREALRVLRPGGQMLVIDYHVGPLLFPRGWLQRGFTTFVERIAGRAHYRGFRHFVTHGAIPGLAAAHGLRVEARRVMAQGNFAIFVLRHGRSS